MSKIIKCKYDSGEIIVVGHRKGSHSSLTNNTKIKEIQKGQTVVIENSTPAEFFLDLSCFDSPTKSSIKWTVVYTSAYNEAKEKGTKINSDFWALNQGQENIAYLGMNKHYKIGNSLKISNAKSKSYYYGYSQLVLIFTDKPEDAFYFYLVPITTPSINYAYFKDSEKKWQYGDIADLTVQFHNIPYYDDNTTKEKSALIFVVEDNAKNRAWNEKSKLKDIKEASVFSQDCKMTANRTGANKEVHLQILLDYENWRKGEHKEKTFSVIVAVYEVESGFFTDTEKVVYFRNFLIDPTNDLLNYNSALLGMKDTDAKKGSISSRIVVNKDFMSELLRKKEVEKNNMIQYIGDIDYTHKEHNPCGYSVIKVKEDKREATIFDENKKLDEKIKDKTHSNFDIISGESPKKVSVTAKWKKDAKSEEESIHLGDKYLCEKILNDGHKHLSSKDVFKMEHIVGQWVPSVDPSLFAERYMKKLGIHQPTIYHPSNASSAPKLEWNKPDQDAKGMEVSEQEQKKYEAVTVAEIQGLTNKDYHIDGDSITLQLKYHYNKHIAEDSPIWGWGYAGEIAQNTVDDHIWMFNYFKLWDTNNIAQTYFVPVSTCRYPNQIARIRVFPNIKWKISLLLSDKSKPQSYASKGMPIDASKIKGTTPYHLKERRILHDHQQKARDATLKRQIGTSSYDFDLVLSCIVDGHPYEKQKTIAQKIKTFVEVFKSVKETMDTLCHNDESHAKNLIGKVPKPKGMNLYLKFDYPSIKIDGGWEYGEQPKPNDNVIETIGKIRIGLEPLIRAEGGIDLIALAMMSAETIPIVGEVLIALELIETGVQLTADYLGYEISRKLELNIYAFSQIDVRAEISINAKDAVNMQVDGRLGVGVQLKAEAGVVKKSVTFEADNPKNDFGIGVSFDAKGESYVELLGKAGIDKEKGFYLQPQFNFGGVKVTIVGKSLVDKKKNEKEKTFLNKPITVVDPKPDFLGKVDKFYPFS